MFSCLWDYKKIGQIELYTPNNSFIKLISTLNKYFFLQKKTTLDPSFERVNDFIYLVHLQPVHQFSTFFRETYVYITVFYVFK